MFGETRRVAVVTAAVVSLLLGATVSTSRAEVKLPAQARRPPGQDWTATDPGPAGLVDWELQSELEGYLGSQTGLYGLAVRNLVTGQTVLVNEDREFHAASTL